MRSLFRKTNQPITVNLNDYTDTSPRISQNSYYAVELNSPSTFYRTYSFLKKNFFGVCVAIATLSLLVPVATNPIKDSNPLTQRNIKIVVYTIGSLFSIAGIVNEYRPKTKQARRFHDADVNRAYMQSREQYLHQGAMGNLRLDITREQEQHLTAASFGRFGLGYSPMGIAAAGGTIAPNSLTGSNLASQAIASGDYSSFTVPQVDSSFLPGDYDMDTAYGYITTLNNPNMLLFGDTGDCKTSLMHKLLHSWIMKEPNLIPYVVDRKFFGGKDPVWRSCWSGMPVYKDLTKLVANGVPSPSVYVAAKPELDRWLAPVAEVVYSRMETQDATDDPLYDPKTGTWRTIVCIVDDATTILDSMDRQASANAIQLINDIATLGRSLNVHIWYIAHGNTSNSIGLSQTAIKALNPVVGASMSLDPTTLQWSKKPFVEAGLQRVQQDVVKKARGFATTWPDVPYIPPAEVENGLRDFLMPDMCCLWHKVAPEGFITTIDFHQECFAKHEFDIENRETSAIAQPKELPAAVPTEGETEVKTEDEAIAKPAANPVDAPTDNGDSSDEPITVEATPVSDTPKGKFAEDDDGKVPDGPWDNVEMAADDIALLMRLREWFKKTTNEAAQGMCAKPTIEAAKDSYAQLKQMRPNDPAIQKEIGVVWHMINLSDAKFHAVLYDDPAGDIDS